MYEAEARSYSRGLRMKSCCVAFGEKIPSQNGANTKFSIEMTASNRVKIKEWRI